MTPLEGVIAYEAHSDYYCIAMPSLSSAYRPQRFADVTGQASIKQTLQLEVKTGKIGHAYLFSGPRGVGKTTTARIFAKALNCLNQQDGEPCNTCSSCADIDRGAQLDVIEMDAASNTGVDNVRSAIIEHVRFVPQRRHKIYILDEAHMLSASAWNAMLKTIEEPPSYAIFLFLTTEIHKVPATIMSRCQRFDFTRIGDMDLAQRIQTIAEAEHVTIAADVIKTIVGKSDGCLRDAESLLGQLLVLGEKNITSEVASLVLPVSHLPLAADILATCASRNLGNALLLIEDLESRGVGMASLFDDMIQAVRLLLLGADTDQWKKKLADGDEGERKLAVLINAYEPAELSKMALMLMERRRDIKQGADARFCLELAATAIVTGLLKTPSQTQSAPAALPSQPVQRKEMEQKPAAPAPVPVSEKKAETTQAPTPTAAAQVIELAEVQAKWPAFMRLVDEKSKSVTFVMKIAHPLSVNGNVVTISFQYPFHKEKVINDTKTRHLVEACLREALGVDVTIEGVVAAESEASQEARSKDIVTNILKAFGGQIVDQTST